MVLIMNGNQLNIERIQQLEEELQSLRYYVAQLHDRCEQNTRSIESTKQDIWAFVEDKLNEVVHTYRIR